MKNFIKNFPNNKIFLGIDEAGRGSVIGPLVFGNTIAKNDVIDHFNDLGVTDSKLIKKGKRKELAEAIKELSLKAEAIAVEPKVIDNSIRDQNDNLNTLEIREMVKIIQTNTVSDIFIDAISTPRYTTSEIRRFLMKDSSFKITRVSEDKLRLQKNSQSENYKINLLAQNKADLNYKIVSAASIIAKTVRDETIRNLEVEYSLKEGILASGYPNNQLISFFKKYKQEIRKREFNFIRYEWNWAPLQNILTGTEQKRLQL